jgi:hypothetical protein
VNRRVEQVRWRSGAGGTATSCSDDQAEPQAERWSPADDGMARRRWLDAILPVCAAGNQKHRADHVDGRAPAGIRRSHCGHSTSGATQITDAAAWRLQKLWMRGKASNEAGRVMYFCGAGGMRLAERLRGAIRAHIATKTLGRYYFGQGRMRMVNVAALRSGAPMASPASRSEQKHARSCRGILNLRVWREAGEGVLPFVRQAQVG